MQLRFDFVKNYDKAKISNLPSYKKRYVVFAYDSFKYRAIWEKIKKLAIKYNNPNIYHNANPYKILEHCYIKEDGKKKYLGDVKHVFRYSVLEKIHILLAQEIFNYQMKFYFEDLKIIQDGVIIHLDADENQAEIDGTQYLPLRERIKKHIELIRLLRSGYKLKKAVKKVLKHN